MSAKFVPAVTTRSVSRQRGGARDPHTSSRRKCRTGTQAGDRHVHLNIETKIDPNHPENRHPEHSSQLCSICCIAENLPGRVHD